MASAGCYAFRNNHGGAQTAFEPPRRVSPVDVALPAGYQIEAVAQGLNFPTGVTFDREGHVYVVEAGYSYGEVWATPRLLRIQPGRASDVIASGGRNGPWTGVAFHQGAFYVSEGGELEGGRILRVAADGAVQPVVQNLPSQGDHHTDAITSGPDGWLYFGQGTASNSGVVGEDNAEFGWLKRNPQLHDIPGQDILLSGQNFASKDVLKAKPGKKDVVVTGGFSAFGTSTSEGQRIKGRVPCNGSVMRIRPEGGPVELVAWGLRNPFGLAFAPDGQLYATENGYDDRGSRPVWGAADALWAIRPGLWYGWPDFSAGVALTNDVFRPPGKAQPRFLLEIHPNDPPQPVARFGVHAAATGFDFSRQAAFAPVGDAFVALFGDESPFTGKLLHPVGFKVVRVNVQTGAIEDFAVNRGSRGGPASQLGGAGLERPIAVRFDPAGTALYVVDFGVLNHPKKRAVPHPGTGVLWRITRQ